MAISKSRSGTPTTANAQRGRPMVTITLAPESIATIDRRRGKLSRGEYIELLLETAGGPIVHDSEFGTRGWATLRSVRRRKK